VSRSPAPPVTESALTPCTGHVGFASRKAQLQIAVHVSDDRGCNSQSDRLTMVLDIAAGCVPWIGVEAGRFGRDVTVLGER
jgi:hypothetical protein